LIIIASGLCESAILMFFSGFPDGKISVVAKPPTARLMILKFGYSAAKNFEYLQTHALSLFEGPAPAAVDDPNTTITYSSLLSETTAFFTVSKLVMFSEQSMADTSFS